MLLLNQAFMMLWEAILENAMLVGTLFLLLLITWSYWGIVGRHQKLAYRFTTVLAAIAAGIGFFTLPLFFNSSLGSLNYWVDWAFHLAMVAALFVYAYVVILPLITGLAGLTKRSA